MKKILAGSALWLFPAIALAQTIESALGRLQNIIGLLTPMAVAIALLFFFYGLAKYILNAGDEDKKKAGRSIMVWGVIALFVMVSVWGLVRIIGQTFGVTKGGSITVPLVPR